MIQRKSSYKSALGVSVVIGALLMLTVLVIAATQYQTQVIPVQEEETEIEHNRLIRNQMSELNSEMQGTANSGDIRTQPLQLGTSFESRIIFGIIPAINQPSPAGNLEYESASSNVQIKNVQGLAESQNYWDGSQTGNYQTGFLTYEPEYRHFQDAPDTYVENGLTVNYYEQDDNYVSNGKQNIINNNNIQITTVTSDININTIGTRTVEAHPVSAPSETITIEADDSTQDIVLEIPTKLNQETWDDLLEEEIDSGNVNSVNVDEPNNLMTINLDGGSQVYTLTLSRVHLTTRENASPVPQEDEQYIAWDSEAITIQENSRNQINAQVRDKFNNPVLGVETQAIATDQNGDCIGNFNSPSGTSSVCPGLDQPGEQISGNNGELRFIYEAPEVNENTDIDITIDFK